MRQKKLDKVCILYNLWKNMRPDKYILTFRETSLNYLVLFVWKTNAFVSMHNLNKMLNRLSTID